MQRFLLYRFNDLTGYSGTGTIVEGVIFSDGTIAVHWLTKESSIGIYNSIESFLRIHGHDGNSVVELLDNKPFQIEK